MHVTLGTELLLHGEDRRSELLRRCLDLLLRRLLFAMVGIVAVRIFQRRLLGLFLVIPFFSFLLFFLALCKEAL